MLCSQKKCKMVFLTLPHALQDEIMDGVESNRFTLTEASRLASERGYSISHQAIAGYCEAVRAMRRMMFDSGR
jgi:hypothetical protein